MKIKKFEWRDPLPTEILVKCYLNKNQIFSINYLGYKIIINDFSSSPVIRVQNIDDPSSNLFEYKSDSKKSVALLAQAMSEIEALALAARGNAIERAG